MCSRSRVLAGSRVEKTRNEPSQPVRVLTAHRRELHSHSLTGLHVADRRVSSNFAFRNGKQNGNYSANRRRCGCRNKKAANVQIAYATNGLFLTVLLPCDPNATRRCDSRKTPVMLPVFAHTQPARFERCGVPAHVFSATAALDGSANLQRSQPADSAPLPARLTIRSALHCSPET